jgi:glyoxylase-like metal-dependent hydrolase (beta-lactamase superfamily II)
MALLDVLHDGSVSPGVTSSVSLVRSGDVVAVVDPGMVPSRAAILDPLAALGVPVEHVTDVIISHHHPDHTINIALFPNARVHDHWAIYKDDVWTSRPAEGFEVGEGITLIETPGHTPQDITTLVATGDGVAALTHLWGYDGAETDRLATSLQDLHANRDRVLQLATMIVPGHGPAFPVTAETPR